MNNAINQLRQRALRIPSEELIACEMRVLFECSLHVFLKSYIHTPAYEDHECGIRSNRVMRVESK